MKTYAIFVLCFGISSCGPSVEFEHVATSNPRPRPAACHPGAAPTLTTNDRQPLSPPPAALAQVVFDPESNRALIIGGLSSSGVYAKRISSLDLDSFDHQILAIEGDSVDLPVAAGAIWDADNGRAILLGGNAGLADLTQAFAVRVEGNTARITRLPDPPMGSLYRPAAAYDPIEKRVLVTGVIYGDEEKEFTYRATYALDLTLGAEKWSTFVSSENGPPQAELGEARDMMYDPAQDVMVLVGTGTKTTPGRAWVLDLANPKQWIGLSGTFPGPPPTTPSMVWDEQSCSLLYFTRNKSACGFDIWTVELTPSGLQTTALLNSTFGPGGPGYGSIVFDDAQDRLMILSGADCSVADDFLDTVEVVRFER